MPSESRKKAILNDYRTIMARIFPETGIENPTQLSKIIDIPQTTANRKKKSNKFEIEWAYLLAVQFGLSTEWILTGKGPKKLFEAEETKQENSIISKPSEHDENEIEYIPMTGAALSAGGGAFTDSESVRDCYAFKKDWLIRTVTAAKNAVLVGVIGNSMEPTMYNGDVVMLDSGRTHIYDGNIYALRLDDTIMIKRLSLRPDDKIKVISDNGTEHESYMTDRKEIHIIGQIIWYARSLVRKE